MGVLLKPRGVVLPWWALWTWLLPIDEDCPGVELLALSLFRVAFLGSSGEMLDASFVDPFSQGCGRCTPRAIRDMDDA
jgi:hypothetical protein